jgi:hypothetical protein
MPVPPVGFPPPAPAITTLPLASTVTGVLVAFRVKFTVTPAGMLIVVKLKTPSGGSVSVVLVVGLNAPSAPVLPLLKVCANAAGLPNDRKMNPAAITSVVTQRLRVR